MGGRRTKRDKKNFVLGSPNIIKYFCNFIRVCPKSMVNNIKPISLAQIPLYSRLGNNIRSEYKIGVFGCRIHMSAYPCTIT